MDKRYRKDDEWIDQDEQLLPMKGRGASDYYKRMSPARALDELQMLALKSGSCSKEDADSLAHTIREELYIALEKPKGY